MTKLLTITISFLLLITINAEVTIKLDKSNKTIMTKAIPKSFFVDLEHIDFSKFKEKKLSLNIYSCIASKVHSVNLSKGVVKYKVNLELTNPEHNLIENNLILFNIVPQDPKKVNSTPLYSQIVVTGTAK
ncbi:MAG: hypothetical protein NE330_01915 [Lentisphaeraceae bacterium]|nr:hypothetical protein [Lentisphaeraceae bacterium]